MKFFGYIGVVLMSLVASSTFGQQQSSNSPTEGFFLTPEQQREIQRRALEMTLEDFSNSRTFDSVLRELIEAERRKAAERLTPRTVRMRELFLDLGNNRGPYEVQVAFGQPSTIAFLDQFGDPWPLLSAPMQSSPFYQVGWNPSAPHLVEISVNEEFYQSTMNIMLEDTVLPVLFVLKSDANTQDGLVQAKVSGISPISTRLNDAVANRPGVISLLSPDFSTWLAETPDDAREIMLFTEPNRNLRAYEWNGGLVLVTDGVPVHPSAESLYAQGGRADSRLTVYAYRHMEDAIAVSFDGGSPEIVVINY